MSVAFTEQAVRERRKTVTRRKGWWTDKRGQRIVHRGDRLTLCRKVMGRKPGEPPVRICDVEIVSVRREPLRFVSIPGELAREGFLEWEQPAPGEPREFDGAVLFMETYFRPQGIGYEDDVTRIEWRYLDGES